MVPEIIDLIQRMLAFDPLERPNTAEIFDFPWV